MTTSTPHALPDARTIRDAWRPGFVASHTTALALRGIDMPREWGHDAIHLTYDPDAASRVPPTADLPPGVTTHMPHDPLRLASAHGIPATIIRQAFLDIAALEPSPGWLISVADRVVGSHTGRLRALHAYIADHPTHPGHAAATVAAHRARCGTHRFAETRARLAMDSAGLPEPALGQLVWFGEQHSATAMFAWPERRVVAELRDAWRPDQTPALRDRVAHAMFEQHGWTVEVFTLTCISDPDGAWLHNLQAALEAPPVPAVANGRETVRGRATGYAA